MVAQGLAIFRQCVKWMGSDSLKENQTRSFNSLSHSSSEEDPIHHSLVELARNDRSFTRTDSSPAQTGVRFPDYSFPFAVVFLLLDGALGVLVRGGSEGMMKVERGRG